MIRWTGENSFQVNGVAFTLDPAQEGYFVMKSRAAVEWYADLAKERPKNILEVGCYTGGSSVFLFELFSPEKLLAVDARPDIPAAQAFIEQRDVEHRFLCVGDLSQSDRRHLTGLAETVFVDRPLDLIFDDASHLYAPTKETFESLFPYLRPGGAYVIEAWGWAHYAGESQYEDHPWHKEPALTNLLFELTMLAATRPDVVRGIETHSAWGTSIAIVRRGPAELGDDFTLSAHFLSRGKSLYWI